jgi:GNAT superfamily N-acetyltransferase
MDIGRATEAELDALLQLLGEQFDDHGIAITPPLLRQAIAQVFHSDHWALFLVARKGDEMVGLAAVAFSWTLEHAGKTAWLDELYVRPEHRGRGVGTALIEPVIQEAQARGCRAIDLEVEQGHRRAERLYARQGFQPLARSRWVRLLEDQGTQLVPRPGPTRGTG